MNVPAIDLEAIAPTYRHRGPNAGGRSPPMRYAHYSHNKRFVNTFVAYSALGTFSNPLFRN
jgi:hypothetical protein